MYCFKCGKKLDENNRCPNCEPAYTQTVYAQPTYAQNVQVDNGSPKTGLSKAIAGAVWSFRASMISYVALVMLYAYAFIYPSDEYLIFGMCVSCVIHGVIALGLSIPGLILGIKSMCVFQAEKSAGRTKPVATLILGIASLVMVAAAVILAFFTFVLAGIVG